MLILADVFETFRKVSLTRGKFDVDPSHYATAPHRAWEAMLKKTGPRLDNITDTAMYLMVASGMRGGVCRIRQRYTKANNPYLGADYDPNSTSKYIIYLDSNNLYGWAMSKYLPSGHFNWLDEGGSAQIN